MKKAINATRTATERVAGSAKDGLVARSGAVHEVEFGVGTDENLCAVALVDVDGVVKRRRAISLSSVLFILNVGEYSHIF